MDRKPLDSYLTISNPFSLSTKRRERNFGKSFLNKIRSMSSSWLMKSCSLTAPKRVPKESRNNTLLLSKMLLRSSKFSFAITLFIGLIPR